MQPFSVHQLRRQAGNIADRVEMLNGRFRSLSAIACAMVFLVGCTHAGAAYHPPEWMGHSVASYRSNKEAHRRYRLGETRIVTASWYGPGYEHKRTASGERFDSGRYTAASTTLPLDSIVRVTNLKNGRTVYVKVNDRGPGASKRSLDLSPAAARRIGLLKPGVARVEVTPIE